MLEEELHRLLDDVGKGLSEIKSRQDELLARADKNDASVIAQVKELQSMREVLEIHKARLDHLDAVLPKGSKVYIGENRPADESRREARREFGRFIVDLMNFRMRGVTKGLSETFKRSQIEGSDPAGGFLVPEEQGREIISIMERYGVARRVLRTIPMRRQVLRLPTNSDLPDVYWDTELIPPGELVAPAESSVTFARPEAEAHRLIGIDTVSMEIEDDADLTDGIVDYLIERFGIAMSKEEDYQAFVSPGTGTEPFTGLLHVPGIAQVVGGAGENTFETMLLAAGAAGYDYLISTMDAADEDAAESGTWIFSNSILNVIRKIKDSNNMPLFHQMAAGAPDTLLGRPYIRSRVMPKTTDAVQSDTPFILFGNFQFHIMGLRNDIRVDISQHAAFKEAGLVLRIMERLAFKNALTAPFARMRTAV